MVIYLKSSKHVKNANDKKTQTQREKTIKKTITMESKEKVTKKKKTQYFKTQNKHIIRW